MGKPFLECECGEPHPRGCKHHVRRCLNCGTATAYGLEACVKCGSKRLNEKAPCRKSAREGAGSCETHGGNNPVIRNAIARREQEAKAVKILGREGIDPVKHPVEELLDLTATAKTLQRILSENMDSSTDLGGAEYQAWERAFERLTKLLIDLSKLGLEGRKVALDEARAAQASERIEAALAEWTEGLKQQAPPTLHPIINQHLTLLPALLRKHLTKPGGAASP